MKPKLIIAIAVPIVLAIIAVSSISFSIDSAIKSCVVNTIPEMTQTGMNVNGVNMSIFSGRGTIKGLVVGNPEGFHTPSAIKMDVIDFSLNVPSIFSSTTVFDEILIDGAEFYLETSLHGSNIRKIKKNVEEYNSNKTGKSDETDKKILIHRFVLKNSTIHLSGKSLNGKSVPIPIPSVNLTDIGKNIQRLKDANNNAQNMTIRESVAVILRSVLDSVISSVTRLEKLPDIKPEKDSEALGNKLKNKIKNIF